MAKYNPSALPFWEHGRSDGPCARWRRHHRIVVARRRLRALRAQLRDARDAKLYSSGARWASARMRKLEQRIAMAEGALRTLLGEKACDDADLR
jgi:hypothetical protein